MGVYWGRLRYKRKFTTTSVTKLREILTSPGETQSSQALREQDLEDFQLSPLSTTTGTPALSERGSLSSVDTQRGGHSPSVWTRGSPAGSGTSPVGNKHNITPTVEPDRTPRVVLTRLGGGGVGKRGCIPTLNPDPNPFLPLTPGCGTGVRTPSGPLLPTPPYLNLTLPPTSPKPLVEEGGLNHPRPPNPNLNPSLPLNPSPYTLPTPLYPNPKTTYRQLPQNVLCRREPTLHAISNRKTRDWNLEVVKPIVVLADASISTIPSFHILRHLEQMVR